MAALPHHQQEANNPPNASEVTFRLEKLSNELILDIVDHCNFRDLKSLSQANKHLRRLCTPVLFKAVSVGGLDCELHIALEQIARYPHILDAVQTVKIQSPSGSRHDGQISTNLGPYHERLPAVMVQLLLAMPKLVTVRLHLNWGKGQLLPTMHNYIQEHRITMPKVSGVEIISFTPANVGVLLNLFPNVIALRILLNSSVNLTSTFETIQSLKHLETLSTEIGFRIATVETSREIGWKAIDVQKLHQHVPNIKSLILEGALDNTRVSALVDPVSQFKHLIRLVLPAYQAIEPYGEHGNLDGEYRELQDHHPLLEVPDEKEREFFKKCPGLRELRFRTYDGGQYVYVSSAEPQNENDSVSVALFNHHDNLDELWRAPHPALAPTGD